VTDTTDRKSVTHLLVDWGRGNAAALDQLLPIVQLELKRLARRELRRERIGHTLQQTALVNELYLRLVEQRRASWENRAQFFAVSAQIMRRILVDHARARLAVKRGGALPRVTLTEAADFGPGVEPAIEVLEIDRALARLAQLDPDQARIVELRFFAELTVEETAHVMGSSPRTIKREWRLAKAWLYRQLSAKPADAAPRPKR
jgi:RNA polymerase sigma factor (TIGR02999 family)